MNYKVIIPLFTLLAILALAHAKPSPAWVYIMSNKDFKDAIREEQVIQAEKEKSGTQTEQEALQKLSNEIKDAKDSAANEDCWWGPGLCYGSQWGK